GEAYRVPKEDIGSIDALEGEGNLYAKRCERLSVNGNATFAFVYVYLRGCSGFERIPAWKDYVWYVSYGSNMLEDRFLCYIRGGSFEGSRPRSPCSDTTLPLAVKTVDIPYDMYFGNHSGSWHDGGVSFLDTSTEGHSLGVAYLITKEQFDHVASEENGGRYPGGGQWYENIIDLDPIDGIEVKTITNNDLRQYNEPCFEYLETLRKGIRQNWPEMTEEEIDEYLNDCIRG
ncbi:MAG: gamma-glutamylcyclotransferase family protein, partial [Oscillospiraceae bacterium]|nr:gamma-glutamylcyclotransferase family protein [Oscillospiraceae bacterium]